MSFLLSFYGTDGLSAVDQKKKKKKGGGGGGGRGSGCWILLYSIIFYNIARSGYRR